MTQTPRLAGKVALVTGASRGIGRAISRMLAQEGADVIVTATTQPHADDVASELAKAGAKALPLVCDVSSAISVEKACGAAVSVFKRVDILVNNAGVVHRAPISEMTDADFDHVIGVNLAGPFYVARRLLPGMVERRWGRVINISSISGTLACPNNASYGASKWGLNGLTKAMAEELKGTGVLVAAVLPGSVDTDMLRDSGFAPVMTPDEVAGVVRYLCTDAPPAITGSLIEVFG